MPKEKHCVSWKRLNLIRVLVVVAGFGCLVHLNRREGARMSDNPIIYRSSSTNMVSTIPEMEDFKATAYCLTGVTKSGMQVAHGHVAADPKVIPLGSMIYIDSPLMGGIYQVLDTGEMVKGKIVDIFNPSYERCKEFGNRMVKVKVLRYGFHKDQTQNESGK